MNSEKVKEIKESLQRKINRAEKVGDTLVNCVSIDALKMYLTLINELESENERLENENYKLEQNLGQCENGYELELHTARYQLHRVEEDLKKAQDRIAELEKEKAEQLKQFTERLKEKSDYMDSYACGKKGVFIKDIDETLKEVLDAN